MLQVQQSINGPVFEAGDISEELRYQKKGALNSSAWITNYGFVKDKHYWRHHDPNAPIGKRAVNYTFSPAATERIIEGRLRYWAPAQETLKDFRARYGHLVDRERLNQSVRDTWDGSAQEEWASVSGEVDVWEQWGSLNGPDPVTAEPKPELHIMYTIGQNKTQGEPMMTDIVKLTTEEMGAELAKVVPAEMGTIGSYHGYVVLGRNLWTGLLSGRHYHSWFEYQIESLGMIENTHFRVLPTSGNNPLGGRPAIDHYVTLEMAKHIAMAARTERGRQVRDYFIAVEQEHVNNHNPAPMVDPIALSISQAFRLALKDEFAGFKSEVVGEVRNLVEGLSQPKAEAPQLKLVRTHKQDQCSLKQRVMEEHGLSYPGPRLMQEMGKRCTALSIEENRHIGKGKITNPKYEAPNAYDRDVIDRVLVEFEILDSESLAASN